MFQVIKSIDFMRKKASFTRISNPKISSLRAILLSWPISILARDDTAPDPTPTTSRPGGTEPLSAYD